MQKQPEFPYDIHDRASDGQPEIVMIDPTIGYVEGNVFQASRRLALFVEFFRAVDAEPTELRKLADFVDSGKVIL